MGYIKILSLVLENKMLRGLLTENEYNEGVESLKNVRKYCSLHSPTPDFPLMLPWSPLFSNIRATKESDLEFYGLFEDSPRRE